MTFDTKAAIANVGAVLARVDWFSLDSPMGEGELAPRFHGYFEEWEQDARRNTCCGDGSEKSFVTLVPTMHDVIKLLKRHSRVVQGTALDNSRGVAREVRVMLSRSPGPARINSTSMPLSGKNVDFTKMVLLPKPR